MEKNKATIGAKTYLLHWLDYCYYRIVQLYTPEGSDEKEFCMGSIILGFIFIPFIFMPFEKSRIGIIDYLDEHRFLWALIFTFASCFIFTKKMYYRAKSLFENESHRTRVILGVLVLLTVLSPFIVSIILL